MSKIKREITEFTDSMPADEIKFKHMVPFPYTKVNEYHFKFKVPSLCDSGYVICNVKFKKFNQRNKRFLHSNYQKYDKCYIVEYHMPAYTKSNISFSFSNLVYLQLYSTVFDITDKFARNINADYIFIPDIHEKVYADIDTIYWFKYTDILKYIDKNDDYRYVESYNGTMICKDILWLPYKVEITRPTKIGYTRNPEVKNVYKEVTTHPDIIGYNNIRDKILSHYNIQDDLVKKYRYTIEEFFYKTEAVRNNTTFEYEYIRDYTTLASDGFTNSGIGQICIFMEIEELFKIELHSDQCGEIKTFDELCLLIQSKIKENQC